MDPRSIACGAVLLWAAAGRTHPVADRAALSNPLPRAHHALAYDERRGVVVLFGGSRVVAGAGVTLDDYQEWNGSGWGAPRATGLRRSGHRLLADPRGPLYLVGGVDSGRYAGDAWRWTGGAWDRIQADTMLALSEPAVAWDRHRGRGVLYGGAAQGGRPTDRTLEFIDGRWVQVDGSGPGPLIGAGMAYDEARRRIVLHGGIGSGRSVTNRTWEWDGTTWTLAATEGPALANAAMAYDPIRRLTVLFGGSDGSFRNTAETWTWDGRRWSLIEGTGPSRRGLAQMAFDRGRGVMALFGGRIGYPNDSDETWEWNGVAWRQVGPAAQVAPVISATGAAFALSVSDLNASALWYQEKLGLAVTMRAPRSEATRAAVVVLQGGGVTVELVQHDAALPLPSAARSGHGALAVHGIFKVGMQVDDFDATLAALRARGVEIAMGPFPRRADQPANAIIRDNAGNRIQISGR